MATAKRKPANNKTVATNGSIPKFLDSIDNQTRVADCRAVMEMMAAVTKKKPKLWGNSIIGYGEYHYVYDSGREGDMPRVGLSPRKQNLVLYIMPGFEELGAMAAKLGKHKVGKSCLYINKLEDVHLATLKKMIAKSWSIMNKRYPQ